MYSSLRSSSFTYRTRRPRLYYPDDTNPGGGNAPSSGGQGNQNPTASSGAGSTDKPASSDKGQSAQGQPAAVQQPAIQFTPEQQSFINSLVKQEKEKAEVSTEDRVKKQQEAAQADAQSKKELEDLAKQQEWQKLSETQATQIETLKGELKTVAEANSRLAEMGSTILQARIKVWPEDVMAGFKGDLKKIAEGKASAEEVLTLSDWVEGMAPLVEKYVGVGQTKGNGTGTGGMTPGSGGTTNPRGAGQPSVKADAPIPRSRF
jgi:hypothetical protein